MVRLIVAALALSSSLCVAAQDKFIVMASTTSTEQSGLFAHLLPAFKAASGIDVRVVAQGTGQALDSARRGDADVVFVHDMAAEEKFVAEGFGVKSRAKRRAPARRDPKDGEFRASRMLRLLERAVNDVRVAIDVKQALHSVSELARNYGALLLEEGAVTDTKAAKALEISQAEVVTAAEELERALFRR